MAKHSSFSLADFIQETERKIIDLRSQHKTIREIARFVGKSSRDVIAVLKEQQTQDNKERIKQDKDNCQNEQNIALPNVQAYKLFSEGKTPLEATAELNLSGPQVQQFYIEYMNLRQMHKLVTIYQETKDSIGYFLKLFRLGKEEGLTPEQIMVLLEMATNIHGLKEEIKHLQVEITGLGIRKSVRKEELNTLQNDIITAKGELFDAQEAFKIRFDELSEICFQIRMSENYVERFKNGQDYQDLEATVKNKAGEFLFDNKKFLQNVLASVVAALRDDPDRYLLIDKMQLAPFSSNTIINYSSILESRRPSCPQGDEQFIRERVLETAERIFDNLQKDTVDNIISTAVGLKKGGSFPAAYQALPYYESPSRPPD